MLGVIKVVFVWAQNRLALFIKQLNTIVSNEGRGDRTLITTLVLLEHNIS